VLIDARHAIAHNKVMIIDENVVLTGSFNLTKNAEESNAENLLVIRGQATLVEKYLSNFKLHQEHSEPYQGLVGSAATDQKTESIPKVKYAGSKNGDLYHYPSCSAVKRISKDNLVQYDSAPQSKRLHEGCPQ
jgi:phosphatidylserine/phosphatidylglycerophosphate/cardiolipin synthase-like enzyme